MVILLETLQTENLELERTTVDRPFFNPDVDSLSTDAMEIHENARRRNGEPPAASIGLPYVEIEGAEGMNYCALSTGIEDYDDTPVWQLVFRTDEAGYLLHGRSTPNGDDWSLIGQDHQGLKFLKAEVAAGKAQISGFVRRVLQSSGVAEAGEKLIELKHEAKAVHDEHITDNPKSVHPYLGRDKKTHALFGKYTDIGYSSLGVVSMKNVVGWDAESPARMDFSGMPLAVQRAIMSEEIDLKVPTRPTLLAS